MLFSCSFQNHLQAVFKDVHEAYENIESRLKAEQFKVRAFLLFLLNSDTWSTYHFHSLRCSVELAKKSVFIHEGSDNGCPVEAFCRLLWYMPKQITADGVWQTLTLYFHMKFALDIFFLTCLLYYLS